MAGCGIRPIRGNRRRVNPDSSGKKPPLSLRRGVDVGAIFKCPVLGRSPGRAFHCGRSFRRVRFMPEGSLAGAEAPASPHFLSAVAASKQAADVSDHVLRDQEEVTSRRRPHNADPARPSQPRARRLGPGPCGTRPRHGTQLLRKRGHLRIARTGHSKLALPHGRNSGPKGRFRGKCIRNKDNSDPNSQRGQKKCWESG